MSQSGVSASLKALPQGIISLFFVQIFSTLSFSVLYSTLVLFMTGELNFNPTLANQITGVFVAFNYALHLLGGYISGRFISNRSLFSLGMLAQIIGCVFLSFVSANWLYLGLGFFLTGSGLNVTCINCMLTQRFKPEDTRRESAFLWNYAGMNIGFFVGFSLSGYFQLSHEYHQLFLLSTIGNLLAVFLTLYFWGALKDTNTQLSRMSSTSKHKSRLLGLSIICFLPLLLSQLFNFAALANRMVLVTGGLMLGLAFWFAMKESTQRAREKIYAFGILMCVSTVFWTLYQICPMGLAQFIQNNVNREMWGITIAPQWFQNINTVCIVIGGPVLSIVFNKLRARGFDINIPTQFTFALLLIGLAFVLLPLGIARADVYGYVSSSWIIVSYLLQSAGELLISPIGYAMVGALAPARLQGVMMGMWMMTTGVGATLSMYSSNWMLADATSNLPIATNPGYSSVFLQLGIIAIAASLLLALMIPTLKRFTQTTNADTTSENSELATV